MLSPNSLAASITASAISLAEGRSVQDITTLALILKQLADTLATIAGQRFLIEKLLEEEKAELGKSLKEAEENAHGYTESNKENIR